MATGHITLGGEEALIDHEVQEPARRCDIVSGVTEDSPVSTLFTNTVPELLILSWN